MSIKIVKTIDDLEVGMFLHWNGSNIYLVVAPRIILSLRTYDTFEYGGIFFNHTNFKTSMWSYTYAGEYTPVVVSTEAEKIKELKSTIELAQKQLQEYEAALK